MVGTSGSNQTPKITATKFIFNASTGNLTVTGTVTTSSDEALKTNIETLNNSLNKVLQLRGVRYDRIDNNETQIGLIAQEIEKIIPEVVYEVNGVKSVSYGNIVALLIEAIKEQQIQINTIIEGK